MIKTTSSFLMRASYTGISGPRLEPVLPVGSAPSHGGAFRNGRLNKVQETSALPDMFASDFPPTVTPYSGADTQPLRSGAPHLQRHVTASREEPAPKLRGRQEADRSK